MKLQGPVQL